MHGSSTEPPHAPCRSARRRAHHGVSSRAGVARASADPGRDERRGERAMGTQTVQAAARPVRTSQGRVIVDWLTTTDHKKIGHLYLITSFLFFLTGGGVAVLMGAELARPGGQNLEKNPFNPAVTPSRPTMLPLCATP